MAASMPPRVPDAVRAPRHLSWSLTDTSAMSMRGASLHICIASRVLPAARIKRGRQPLCQLELQVRAHVPEATTGDVIGGRVIAIE
ncbi:hypothetical protein XcmpCFBP7700_15720 [Xanthomonas campestris]|nr:hypothetical protein XcmpCFBP7700_15720 [Xanthomonas campestris]